MMLWHHNLKVNNQEWGITKLNLCLLLNTYMVWFIPVLFLTTTKQVGIVMVFLCPWGKVIPLICPYRYQCVHHVYDTYRIGCICTAFSYAHILNINSWCKQVCQFSDDHTSLTLNRNLLASGNHIYTFFLLFLIPSDCKSRRSIWTNFLEGDA